MPYRGYWDEEEEDSLRDAVQKHGIGAWERMRHDPEFKVLKYVDDFARALLLLLGPSHGADEVEETLERWWLEKHVCEPRARALGDPTRPIGVCAKPQRRADEGGDALLNPKPVVLLGTFA
eukprot:367486-Prorocentrum_minimum.AAC.2